MYTLYYSPGAASMAPQAVLEEIAVPFKLQKIDTANGEHQQPAYLALNPAGKIPALTLPDGTTMAECAGICIFLADRHPEAGLAPAPTDRARPAYLQWIMHLTNTLQPADLRFYYSERYTAETEGAAGIKARAVAEIAEIWSRVDKHLEKNGPYLLGERFSAADIFCFMLSTWQDSCPDLNTRFPHVKKLADLVGARPAVQRMLKAN
ncbi:glutathione S-transferase family protein [Dongia soli]|uniref:Glutathione S-transferase family protein n=1 Tax=Dongia soli TaxID=600628 RepID=A0ABU5E7L7_9PROT|nr:glutathione S-transferase family protein [Dongia soli]MDY0882161.1 glutathione S-transferase family protein [Dongia soli]